MKFNKDMTKFKKSKFEELFSESPTIEDVLNVKLTCFNIRATALGRKNHFDNTDVNLNLSSTETTETPSFSCGGGVTHSMHMSKTDNDLVGEDVVANISKAMQMIKAEKDHMEFFVMINLNMAQHIYSHHRPHHIVVSKVALFVILELCCMARWRCSVTH